MPLSAATSARLASRNSSARSCSRSPTSPSSPLSASPTSIAGDSRYRLADYEARARHDPRTLPSWPSLSLNGLDLEQLPQWVCGLDGLQELHLWDNRLSELPEGLASLSSLLLLDVRANSLYSLPEKLAWRCVAGPLQIKYSNNGGSDSIRMQLSLGADGNACEIPGWPTIQMRDMGLPSVPPWVCALRGMQQLLLSHNQLVAVPASLARVLDVSYNRLELLPPEVLSMSRLELLADHNPGEPQIRAERMWLLAGASPKVLPGWPSVSLHGHGLPQLPLWVSQLRLEGPSFHGVKHLHLGQNKLASLPDEIEMICASLESIDLSYNMLQAVPLCLLAAPNLKIMNFAANQISCLPSVVAAELPTIKKYYAATRGSWPKQIGPSLVELDIQFNRMEMVPEAVLNAPQLWRLQADHNPGTLQIYEKFVEALGSRALHRVDTLPQWTCNRPILTLSHVMLREFPTWVGRLEGLVELDLSQNALLELPDSLGGAIESLELINVSHNQLRQLPECFVVAHARNKLVMLFEGNPGERTMQAQLASATQ